MHTTRLRKVGGSVMLAIPPLRSMDLHARKGKRLESIPEAILEDVLSRVSTLFA